MKKILSIILLALFVISSNAQTKQKIIVLVKSNSQKEVIQSVFQSSLSSVYEIIDYDNTNVLINQILQSQQPEKNDSTMKQIGKQYSADIICFVMGIINGERITITARLTEVETAKQVSIKTESMKNEDDAIQNGCMSIAVKLTQYVNKTNLSFDYTGMPQEIEFYRPFKIHTYKPQWVTFSRINNGVRITCEQNRGIENRPQDNLVLLFEDGKEVSIAITQNASEKFFEKDIVEFPSFGGIARIRKYVDTDFDYVLPPVEEWSPALKIKKYNDYFTIECFDNQGNDAKSAQIKLTFGNKIRYLTVSQEKGDFFEQKKVELRDRETTI